MEFLKNRKTLVALALIVGLTLGMWVGNGVMTARAAQAPAADAAPLAVPPSAAQAPTSFAKLAKQLEPSVVQVTSIIEEKQARAPRNRRFQQQPQDDDDGGDLFRRFFGGDPFGGGMGSLPQQPRRAEGTGSGFIVDKNGYIVTNNHVVDGATRVRVRMHDDTTDYNAKVIGTDPELDLAVIKIDAGRQLIPVRIGNSDSVQVGDWSVAIGSPFGLEATVTAGIISAKGRNLGDSDHQIQRFLQTDAAINPGNSGGPLLNINGEVIGVNTMIATSTGAFAGVGFALPSNLAVNSYNQIIKTGKVSRGAIGIQYQREQKPELLKAYGIKNNEGVFVSQVTPGTPAEKAGIKEGDVITAFNGKPVKDGEDLVAQVSQTPVGSKVPVTLVRDGKTEHVTLEVAERADVLGGNGRASNNAPGRDNEPGKQVKFGVSVRNLGANERQQSGLTEQGGVVVTGVDDGSFAEDLGIRENDVLLAINRQPINNVDDLRRVAGQLKPGDAVAFKVARALPQQMGRRAGAGNWQTFFAAGTLPQNQE